MNLRVAGAQIPVTENIKNNFEAVSRAVDFAIEEKADILLTPEGSLSGYALFLDQKEVFNVLENILEKARGKVGLTLGTCYVEENGCCYDQIRFYDRDGRYLGFHGKTLLCSTVLEPIRGEIDYYTPSSLKSFNIEGVTVGGLVCNDLWQELP